MICTKSYLKRLHSRYQISNNTIPNNSMSESFIVIVPTTQKRYVFEKHIVFECSKQLKFMFSKKATKFCEIFPLLLTTVHSVKSKGKISQKFLAFSKCMIFNYKRDELWASSNCTS